MTVRIAASVCDIIYACKALLDEGQCVLDANGIEVFDDADAEMLFEDVGNVFFVIGQGDMHDFKGKIMVGIMIVDIFFDDVHAVVPLGLVTVRKKSVSKKGKGVHDDGFAHEMNDLPV